ncbi:MAG: hypothetical protein MPJ24_00835 [Pirellulaceae bacterium]|nr:hypothetical protein [Pirellulaceae bacterium]
MGNLHFIRGSISARRLIFIVLFSLLSFCLATRLYGQGSQVPSEFSPVQAHWFSYTIRNGYLTVQPNLNAQIHGKQQRALKTEDKTQPNQLTVKATKTKNPQIIYHLTKADHTLTIMVKNKNQVRIERIPTVPQAVPYLLYDQKGETVSFRLGDSEKGNTNKISATTYKSFWHLWLAHPQETKEELLPILHLLNPKWALTKQFEEIKLQLLASTRTHNPPDRKKWGEWLADLGHSSYSKRLAATQNIYAQGPSILPFLLELNLSDFDSEQRLRIRNLKTSLTQQKIESPHQIAQWLRHDPQVWVSLLSSPEASSRVIAYDYLQKLRPENSVQFDPQAALLIRISQLEKLRQEIK